MKGNLTDCSFEWIDAGRPTELSAWDEFVRFNPRGHYCGYSTWLQSFAAYGFDAEVLVAKAPADGRIVGGLGVIRFGYGPLKLAGAAVGPLVAPGHEALVPQLLDRLSAWARDSGVAFVQMQLLSAMTRDECHADTAGLLPASALDGSRPLQEGRLLKVGLPSGQMNLVSLHPEIDGPDGDEAVLTTFSQRMRREVRWALRHVHAPYSARNPSQIREGYALIEENGREHGYATRGWKDVEWMLCAQVERGQGEMICLDVDGVVVASAYVLIAGRTMTYSMGGTKRLKPDLRAGAHVHWAAMRRARELGLANYNVTAMGTEGIATFKAGFNPRRVDLVPPCYLNVGRIRTGVIRRALTLAQRHKAKVGRVLSGVRRLAGRA